MNLKQLVLAMSAALLMVSNANAGFLFRAYAPGLATPPAPVAAVNCALPWGGELGAGSSMLAYQALTVAYGGACASETRTCTNGTLSGSYANPTCSVASPASCALPWGGSVESGASVTAYWAESVAFGGGCSPETRVCTNGALSGSYNYGACAVQEPASCSLPWGGTLGHGTSITAYQTASVASGSSCASQVRSCYNGVLSGAYQYSTCVQEKAYAKWTTSSAYTTSADGLTLVRQNGGGTRATVSMKSGKWYWEVTQTVGTGQPEIGVANASMFGSSPLENAGAVGMYLQKTSNANNCAYTGCGFTPSPAYSGLPVPITVGIALDLDNNTIDWYVNGTKVGTTTTANSSRWATLVSTKTANPLYPAIGMGSSGGDTTVANFGNTPFQYAVPAGYNAGVYN